MKTMCCSTHKHLLLQIVGSRLRIPQVTPADSGEYVCHVSNGAGSQETSLIVTIQGSGSAHGEHMRSRGFHVGVEGSRVDSEVPDSLFSDSIAPTPLCPSAQHLPTHKDRVLILHRGRRAEFGAELRGSWAASGYYHVVQAWWQPSCPPPGMECSQSYAGAKPAS